MRYSGRDGFEKTVLRIDIPRSDFDQAVAPENVDEYDPEATLVTIPNTMFDWLNQYPPALVTGGAEVEETAEETEVGRVGDFWRLDGPSMIDKIGELVTGTVKGVARHGVFVDIGADYIAHIDLIYIDEGEFYYVGDKVTAYLERFTVNNMEYHLRPPGKLLMSEWLKEKRKESGNGDL
jgi:hypothetical protein